MKTRTFYTLSEFNDWFMEAYPDLYWRTVGNFREMPRVQDALLQHYLDKYNAGIDLEATDYKLTS